MGNLDFVGPLREERNNSHQVLGPERWEKGKVYVDEQTYKVPAEVTGAEVTVYRRHLEGRRAPPHRQRPERRRQQRDRRQASRRASRRRRPSEHTPNDVPELTVNKLAANDKITIDGKADEPEWGGAASTGPFVDVGTGKPNTSFPVNGSAKLALGRQEPLRRSSR